MPSLSSSTLARVGLRSLQSLSALVALGALCSAFRREARFGRSIMLGSPAISFALLTSYTAALFALYALSAKHQHAIRRTILLIDVALALALVATGLLLATSDYVAECQLYDGAVHCATLRTATSSAFVAHAAFLGSAVLAAIRDTDAVPRDEDDDDEDATELLGKTHRE